MPANPLIPLGVKTPDIGSQVQNFTALHNRKMEEDRRNEIFSEKVKAERERFEAAQAAADLERAQKEYAADLIRTNSYIDANKPELAREHLAARAERLRAAGRDPSDTLDLLNKLENDPEAFDAMRHAETTAAYSQGLVKPPEAMKAPPSRTLTIGEETVTQELGPDGKWVEVARAPRRTSQLLTPEEEEQKRRIAASGRAAAPKVPHTSAKTELFADGSALMATSGGTTRFFGPDGLEKFGEDRIKGLSTARESGVLDQQDRSAARAAGAQTVEQVGKYAEQLNNIRANVVNLDRAIEAIDKGADTGPIMSLLPSMTQASVQLDNIRQSLGLDVVKAVTFGALSEGEMRIAMSTALPTGLQPPELKQWVIEKRNAQAKLGNYIQGAIAFLGQGGTIAEWERQQEQIAELDGSGKPKAKRMKFDAQGNLIQ